MRENLEDVRMSGAVLAAANKFETLKQTLTGTTSLPLAGCPMLMFLDPGGAGRTVNLPAEFKGGFLVIVNTADAAENLTVKDDTSVTTIGTVGQAEIGFFFCDGTTWFCVVGVA
jgi:hypothetical protein